MRFVHGLVLFLISAKNQVQAATCGGGTIGDGVCSGGLCCSQWGWCGSTAEHCTGSCGNGQIGNGVCADPNLCCSEFGWCGSSAEHCNGTPTQPAPTAPPPVPTNPVPTAPVVPSSDNNDNRLIAYLGNWQACPTADQVAAYTHIMISFAVSYTWSPDKNNCDINCNIATPPVCNNQPNPGLIQQWKSAGKKVLLSFGGAGMGGSWAGDNNDCWDYCFDKAPEVASRLGEIVAEMGLDGVDIDYEYFHDTQEQKDFLKDLTVDLRNILPVGSIITHAPMDSDLVPDTGYYDVLQQVGWALDFLCPQYYNGITRPALDGFTNSGYGAMSAYNHYTTLINGIFGGDETKIVFGFCISDCSGTGSNANANQAVTVMNQVRSEYPCNGGAFFWVAAHDIGGSWSSTVNTALEPYRGCSLSSPPTNPPPTNPPPTNPPPTNPPPTNPPPTNPPPTNPPPTNPPPTNPPPTNPPPTNPPPTNPPPTNPPPTNPPPTNPPPTPTIAPSQCCPSGYTGLRPYNDCTQYYHCVNGVVTGDPLDCTGATLFDFGNQVCNWDYLVTCTDLSCDGGPPPTAPPPTNPPPTNPPPTNPPPTNPPPTNPPPTNPPPTNPPPTNPPPTNPPPTNPPPTNPPPTNPPPTNPPPTSPPPAPTATPGLCCPSGYTGLRPYNGCTQYYHCVNGVVTGDPIDCSKNTLFNFQLQFCDWKKSVTCTDLSCDGGSPPTAPPPTNPPPTNPPPTNPPPTNPPPTPTSTPGQCCPTGYTGLRPYNDCKDYYHCVNGVVTGPTYSCAGGTLFDFNIQSCNWKRSVTCADMSCS